MKILGCTRINSKSRCGINWHEWSPPIVVRMALTSGSRNIPWISAARSSGEAQTWPCPPQSVGGNLDAIPEGLKILDPSLHAVRKHGRCTGRWRDHPMISPGRSGPARIYQTLRIGCAVVQSQRGVSRNGPIMEDIRTTEEVGRTVRFFPCLALGGSRPLSLSATGGDCPPTSQCPRARVQSRLPGEPSSRPPFL